MRRMDLMSKGRVEAARAHAEEATELSRVTRKRTRMQLEAWTRWKARWRELEREPPGERTLVVCSICRRYRDGHGQWDRLPLGLHGMLSSPQGISVSHGLCTACTSRALREVRHLPSPAPASADAAYD